MIIYQPAFAFLILWYFLISVSFAQLNTADETAETSITAPAAPATTQVPLVTHQQELLKSVELWQKILFILETYYFQKIDHEKLREAALKGMLSALDPHSSYFDAASLKKFEKDTSGEFFGLGLEVTIIDGMIVVVSTLEDSAAYKAGLRAGDKILQINKKNVVGLSLEKVLESLKEHKDQKDQKIELSVIKVKTNEVRPYTLSRERVKLKACKFWTEQQFGIFRLTQFQRDLGQEMEQQLEQYEQRVKAGKEKPLLGLVIDVRDNPGGLLDEAVKVASIFLEKGIVVKTVNREGKILDSKEVLKSGKKELSLPMLLLINRGTASAAEILAGALQDYRRALVMGEQSFGKGSVQSLIKLEGDEPAAVKLTVSQYLTPNGREIQQKGLRPDIPFDDVRSAAGASSVASKTTREKDLDHSLRPLKADPADTKGISVVEDILSDEAIKQYPQNDLMVQSAIQFLKGKQLFEEKKLAPATSTTSAASTEATKL